MDATRRRLLTAGPLFAAAATAYTRIGHAAPADSVAAPADSITAPAVAGTTDLALTCDLAAAPAVALAIRAFRDQTGVRVRMFPTPPNLIIPRLQRDIQNDIVLTQPKLLDQAETDGLIAPNGRTPTWRNRVVIATGQQGPPDTFALPDPTPASDFNGTEILIRLDITPQTIYGVIDTATVVALLLDGQARQGLLHQTELAAHPRLTLVKPVPARVTPPILYAATVTRQAVTRQARRADPQAFVQFLATPECRIILQAGGLESAA